VSVGPLRLALIDACAPMLADVIVAGHDRDALGALLVTLPAYASERARLESALRDYDRAHPASSEHIARALVLAQPPSLDDGEITDKGTINQRRVLERRAADVERLFATPAPDDVIVLDR
jgi:feruloyl-CoA synthase